jgi:hypothetical protein
MSIAELIMQGTEQNSKSTAWVSDSLQKIGQNVSAALKEREQQKQAQAMMPFLQQNMQESLKLAQEGKSGEAYSKMFSVMTPQTMNNPQIANVLPYYFKALGDTADNNLMSQRITQGTSSGMDSILPILALTNPQMASQLAAARGQTGTQSAATQTTPNPAQPNNAAFGGTDTANLPTLNGDPNGIVPGDGAATLQSKAPSQTQAATADAMQKNYQALDSGKTFGDIVANVDAMVFTPDKLFSLHPQYKKISGLSRYLPGVEGVASIPEEALSNKSISISSKGGMSATFANDPEYQKDPKKFLDTITENVGILNQDQGIQDAIKILGGIDKISFVSSGRKGESKVANLPEGSRIIRISDDTKKALNFVATLPQSAKNANSPLFGRGDDMPAPLQGRDVKSLEGKIGTDPKTGKQFKIVNGQPVAL